MELNIIVKSLGKKLFPKLYKLDVIIITHYIVDVNMSKKCELTGKIPMKGHNVSQLTTRLKEDFYRILKK